jgi:pilus assembly protein CpaD
MSDPMTSTILPLPVSASKDSPMRAPSSSFLPSRRLRVVVPLMAITAMLAACQKRLDTTATFSQDYRQNHAIQLQRGQETLDIFVGRRGPGLDERQSADVRGFAARYMERGEGPLIAYLPSGRNGGDVSKGLNDIRRALSSGGAAGRLQISHYHPQDPDQASVIRLTFAALKAQTPHPCSAAGVDSAVGPANRFNRENSITFNFGCSYQQNLAAQIDDPRDLVRPRRESDIDTQKRAAAIERLREGSSAGGENNLLPAGRGIDKSVGPQ